MMGSMMSLAGERWDWLTWLVASSPIWGTLLWHTWELSIRPRLIPAGDIKAIANELIARHGLRAEEIAVIEEDRAWRYSHTFDQGKLQRVRRELRHRYEAGEWNGRGGAL
jgi:hypothetical protein